jgi:hypothetical protein
MIERICRLKDTTLAVMDFEYLADYLLFIMQWPIGAIARGYLIVITDSICGEKKVAESLTL